MSYTCPNPNNKPFGLWQVVDLLESSPDFAQFFATQLRSAMGGDKKAAACVESYLQPFPEELAALGIGDKSEIDMTSMCKCTEVGRLVIVKAQEMAPGAFR